MHELDGKETLDILDTHRDCAETLKDRLDMIAPEYSVKFGRLLNAAKFSEAPEYQEMKERIDQIKELNKKITKECCEQFVPDIIDGVKTKSSEFLGPEGVDKVAKRLKNTRVVFLDLYRFYAKIASEGVKEETGGFYLSSENIICLCPMIPLSAKREFGIEYEDAYLSTILTHELLHASSASSFWVKAEVQEDDKSPMFLEQSKRQSGLSVIRPDGTVRLTWLNEGVTAYLTREIVSKNLTGNEELDEVIKRLLRKTYFDYQAKVEDILKKIPREVLFGAYFDASLFLDLDRAYKKTFGISLAEAEKEEGGGAVSLRVGKEIIAQSKPSKNM